MQTPQEIAQILGRVHTDCRYVKDIHRLLNLSVGIRFLGITQIMPRYDASKRTTCRLKRQFGSVMAICIGPGHRYNTNNYAVFGWEEP